MALLLHIPFFFLVVCVNCFNQSPKTDLKGTPISTLYWQSNLSNLSFILEVETPHVSIIGLSLPMSENTSIIAFGRNRGFPLSNVEIHFCSGICDVHPLPSEENILPHISGSVFFNDTHTILEFTWDFQIYSEFEISHPEMKIFLKDSDDKTHFKIYPLVVQTGGSETIPYTPRKDTKNEKNSDKWHVTTGEWNVAVGGLWQGTVRDDMPKRSLEASSLYSLGYTMTQNLITGILDLYWKPVGDTDTSISLALVGQATGWLGVGFSQSGGMVVSDAIVGYMNNGLASVHAYQLKQYAQPNGVNPNLPLRSISGTQVDGVTTLFFIRDFNSGSFPIVPSGWNLMIAALQSDNDINFVYHGNTRQPSIWVDFSYSPPPPNTTDTVTPTSSPNPNSTLITPTDTVFPTPESSTSPSLNVLPPIGNTLQDQGYTFSKDIIPGILILYWKPISPSDTTISFALEGFTQGFVGVGWSPDGGMIGSDAVIGWVQNGVATIQSYYLQQEDVPPLSTNLPLQNTFGTEISGVTTIYFVRDFSSGYNPIPKSGFINVIGSYQNQDALVYHGLNGRASIEIDFSTGVSTASLRPFGPKDIHALLMFLSWGVILPLGMLWARYTRALPNAVWFKVHRVTQYSGVFIALVGIVVIFSTTKVHYTTVYHGQVGTAVMILAVIQVVVAFFRPHKESNDEITFRRKMFEYFHWWNGRVLVFLGVFQMFSGVTEIGYPNWVYIAYGCLVGVVVFGVLVREIQNCFFPFEKDIIIPCFFSYKNVEFA